MTKVRILVVEDEILIADNICDTLEDFGYEALEPAINYTEAIETLKEDAPDIAILDINLSGNKTGIDVANVIKEKYNIPFIFLTSNSDHKMVEEVKLVNPNAFLVKPFVKDELYSAIEIAIYNFDKKEVSSLENLFKEFTLFAYNQGIIVVDTKLEVFVNANGEWLLGDEILTPESSRFIAKEDFDNGDFISMDKQILRDFAKENSWKEKAKNLKAGEKLDVEVPDSIKNTILTGYATINERLHR